MLSRLLASVPFQRFLAGAAVRLLPSVLRFGKTVIVLGWKDVADVLTRDDDFRLGPINRARIEGVSGPFFLGMDRCPAYFQQRQYGYAAMASVNLAKDSAQIKSAAQHHLDQANPALDIVGDYARPIAAQTAARIFGISGPSQQHLMQVARNVFHETFLNLSDQSEIQKRGREAGNILTDWTRSEITKRKAASSFGNDFLAALMSDPNLGDDDVTHVVNGYMIGAIDTTATVVANVVYEIVSDNDFSRSVAHDLDDMGKMMGWCMEALRRRPHNPLLVREAANATEIGGVQVLPGDRVLAMTFSAHQDPARFPSPGLMNPSRPKSAYMHFGYGPHICAGRDLNTVQIPILVAELLKRRPKLTSKIQMDGPFPNSLFARLGD